MPLSRRSLLQNSALLVGASLAGVLAAPQGASAIGLPGKTVFPGEHWTTKAPEALGLSPEKLAELSAYVGGNGVVVRDGYLAYSWGSPAVPTDIASAFKPMLSTYLMIAVQQGRIGSVDDPVADWEPRLLDLNGGKDAGITWRHLATMTSGYGLVEAPGAAFGYNDYAITLYYDTLMKVFGAHGTDILRTTLAEPLQFEDSYTHDAFGPTDRAGRLAMSVRDWARVGLLYQQGGKWGEERLMKHPLVKLATSSPIPPDVPFTSGIEAPMLPGQRNLGGGKNQSTRGPGFYSFNWWLNQNSAGELVYPAIPADTYSADGHWGRRKLWIIPSQDLVVVWNNTRLGAPNGLAWPEQASLRATEIMRDMVVR